MSQFLEMRSNNPKLTQEKLAKVMYFSVSTIKLYTGQLNVSSYYKRKVNERKTLTTHESSANRIKHLKASKN